MGGSSSSSSSTTNTTKNNSGSAAAQGDNLGVMVAGVADSTVNINAIDAGAIEAGKEIANNAIKANTQTMTDALKNGQESLENAFNYGEGITKTALDNMRDNNDNLSALAKSVTAQAGEDARNAIALANNITSRQQVGDSDNMSKVAIAMAIALGLAVTTVIIKGRK